MSAIMEKINVNGVGMDRLENLILEQCHEMLSGDAGYTAEDRKCVELFNALKSTLNKEQKEALMAYEDQTCVKESVVQQFICKEVLNIISRNT